MSDAIDLVKRHFDQKGFKCIDVAEWADDQGKPLEIFYDPLTVKGKDHLKVLHDKYGDTVEWLVVIIIRQAKDAQGKPLFTMADKPTFLRHADPAVIERVATAILVDGGDIQAEKKN